MAVFLNNQVGVKINSVDLSDLVTAVTINRSFDELEVTAMGDSAHKFVKGLEASSVTIDFLNDTAATKTLATLQAAWEQLSQQYLFKQREQRYLLQILFTQFHC